MTADALVALVALAGAAFVLTVVFTWFLALLFRFGGAGERGQARSLLGALAEVVLAVPGDGVGRIRTVSSAGKLSLPARSYDGVPLSLGSQVVVVEVKGRVALVAPLTGVVGA